MNNETLLHIGGRLKIAPKNIRLLKADINYTEVHLDDGRTIISSITLGILEKRLQEFSFFRPNRSVVINLDYVVGFEESSAQIKMENNEIFKISCRRAKHFYDISKPKISGTFMIER
ncbi:hypothetical protein GCM10011514_09280 [Emticicia aquatilis]|uniref:HTH LytTR-type domain-containing protein n=1 Tax=Emticicia aquatilis TaxID=1537369 RepID=A0A917DLD4_9BACT|nr:LytTR family DNA-binding domain-containing protein [Emticicia aquatilis]GGD47429.1 hypothetical protein GCM10011514_09280 [Emticicia aquatilis]